MKKSSQPPEPLTNPALHDAIARHAYELWEREGRGHGSHERHWLEAERQLKEPATETLHFPPSEAGHPVGHGDGYSAPLLLR